MPRVAQDGYGSWLCENALARDRDGINVSQKSLLVREVCKADSILPRLRKILLAAFRFLAFLHNQGHERPGGTSSRYSHVRYAPSATVGLKKAACREGPEAKFCAAEKQRG
jgi:hypothetical protein